MRLPFYEQLCAAGIEFTQCKSVHPLCLPCRASMLTGVYTHKHKQYRNDVLPKVEGLPLVGDLLHENGIAAGYFGKNHSGYEDLDQHGFEGYFPRHYGNPYASKEYAEYIQANGYSHPNYMQEWCMSKPPFVRCGEGMHDLMTENAGNMYGCGYLDTDDPVHEADFVTSLAAAWLKQHKDVPFVLRVDTWGPHHTYTVPKKFRDTLNPAEIELSPSLAMKADQRPDFMQDRLRQFNGKHNLTNNDAWAFVLERAYEHYAYIDAALGKLAAELAFLGIADQTAILLTADHGDAIGSCGGMFDKAGDMPEELMEIPMALYLPGEAGNRKIASLTSNLDVAPTVLELSGITPPAHMDGRSLYALAQGRIAPRKRLLCEHYGHFLYYTASRALYNGDYKLIITQNNKDQLYNIAMDPFEMNNLVDNNAYACIYAQMKNEMAQEELRLGDISPWTQIDTSNQRRKK